MARSLDQLAELVLKRFYGGQLRTSDQKVTRAQVRMHLVQARDNLLNQELREELKTGNEPDEAFFTRFENHPILYNEDRDIHYLELPDGYVDLPHDKGIRIGPMKGIKNIFIRIPSGYVNSRREYAWLEGNLGWQLAPAKSGGNKIIEFPTMQRETYGVVLLDVITESGNSDPNSPLGMPSRYEELVVKNVLSLLGYNRVSDEANDNRDQV